MTVPGTAPGTVPGSRTGGSACAAHGQPFEQQCRLPNAGRHAMDAIATDADAF
eukprot:gene15255-19286_t